MMQMLNESEMTYDESEEVRQLKGEDSGLISMAILKRKHLEKTK